MALTITDLNNDGDLWIECDCGACSYKSKLGRSGLTHRRTCRTREQYSEEPSAAVAAASAESPEVAELERLKKYGQSVRRTGLTGGRTEDLVAAVRGGYLSVSDAMNSDD